MIERFSRCVAKEDAFVLGPQEDLSRWFTMPPRIGVRPRDAEQCAAVLREAAELRSAVVPWGGGQHQELGNVPRPVEVVLSTGGMSGLVEYDVADQTIVVRAGTRLADLVAHVREDGLWLPLDPPGLARATIGGVVAANANGPLRAGYGRPRDLVLGARMAYSDGTVAKSGGRLVKNVTGFDLHRLFCGSLGSLGVLCEIALRLRPLPEREASVVAYCDDTERVDAVLGALRGADEGVACCVVDRETAQVLQTPWSFDAAANFAVIARFHGLEAAVARALTRCEDTASRAGATTVERLEGAEETGSWAALREWRGRSDPSSVGVVLRYRLPAYESMGVGVTSVIGGLIDAVIGHSIAETDHAPSFLAEPTLGELRVLFRRPPSDSLLSRLVSLITNIPRASVSIESGPASWRAERDVHCGFLSNVEWTLRLKRALDPAGILSPGRLVFGGER